MYKVIKIKNLELVFRKIMTKLYKCINDEKFDLRYNSIYSPLK